MEQWVYNSAMCSIDETDVLVELLSTEYNKENVTQRYRYRAMERRDGVNPDYPNEDPITSIAVAPDAKSRLDTVEQRSQMIQESKFLSDDKEYTQFLKGLE
ncbi:hypothetical protein NPIL_344541 [Nephila pilipes]|uniref:RED-like N-terminal domain-containing protein n=1 Tax=Nephila pilipes TaxID=299642 RepID=A0A8X6IRX2_NEPPI|nr:hypothetical protein NPIL_344541 [Nephila pilipes]